MDRPYDPKMIYNWSIGLIGTKDSPAIRNLVSQLETALINEHKEGRTPHLNLFYLIDELRDRADEPSWRLGKWEN